MANDEPTTSPSFKWWICGLLLLATTLNYMDRQALSQTGPQIKAHFGLSNEQFGLIEGAFNAAFAIGALALGAIVDRGNVRWIYPLVAIAWSMAGFVAGLSTSFVMLLLCRFWLGLFEAGNWPCGIVTIKRVLKPEERTLGNGMFQSGTALGAILTPLVVLACAAVVAAWGAENESISWRLPFWVVGSAGVIWAVIWLLLVKSHHVRPKEAVSARVDSYWSIWKDRRFWVLIVVIVAINSTWRTFGFWLPTFLQEGRGYSKTNTAYISSAFFLFADFGSIAVGAATLRLFRRGYSLPVARMICYAVCASLTTLSVAAVTVPAGWMLIAVLFAMAFGALGLFPIYFALSQEISAKHQGKVTGTLGCINAIYLAVLFPLQGKLIDRFGSFDISLGAAGLVPLLGLAALYFGWRSPTNESK